MSTGNQFTDIDFQEHHTNLIIGTNGAGKSTLMKIIADQMSPDTGTVNKAKYIKVGYLPQEGVRTDGRTLFSEAKTAFGDTVTLQENIESASSQLGKLDPSCAEYADALDVYGELQLQLDKLEVDKMKPRIEKVLIGLGFNHSDMDREVGEFSGGWQMRIALAKLLLSEPSVLLLDEPTNDLDVDTLRALESGLEAFPGCAVIISHDRWFLDRVATHVLAFEGNSHVRWFEGNFSDYEEIRKKELGKESVPTRVKYKPLSRD